MAKVVNGHYHSLAKSILVKLDIVLNIRAYDWGAWRNGYASM